MNAGGVLLDTCAVIWLGTGEPMAPRAVEAMLAAGRGEGMLVSPVSAWEIGLLSRPRSAGRPGMHFLPDPKTWFSRFLAGPGIRSCPLSPDIAIDAVYLPGDFHADPGDRLLVATARSLGRPIVTRDSKILAYAQAGWVAAIAC